MRAWTGRLWRGGLSLLLAIAGPVSAQSSPLAAEVRDAGTGRLLYRESYLGVVVDGELQSLGISYLDPDGRLLARLDIDLADSPTQPQMRYREPGGARWQMRRGPDRWRRSYWASEQSREDKQWPSLGSRTVMAPLIDRHLARRGEAILAGERDSLSVYYPSDGRERRYDLEAETFVTGRGEMLRIMLIRRYLFQADRRVATVEIERGSGRLWRYTGPARCLCAGDPLRQVEIRYRDR